MKMNIKTYIVLAATTVLTLSSAVAQMKVPAVAMQPATALWNKNDQGIMEWAKIDLDAGTELEVYVGTELDSQGKTKPDSADYNWANAASKKDVLPFCRVRYQDKDYYAITTRIAAHKTAAIVVKAAATYITRHPADIRTATLDVSTVVAIGKESHLIGGIAKVYEMCYFDQDAHRLRYGFIKTNKVSNRADDITALKLLKMAQETKDPARQVAMIESIGQLNPSAAVLEYIDSLTNKYDDVTVEKEPAAYNDILSAGTGEFIAASGCMFVKSNDGSKINIRDYPATGSVIGQVTDGQSIICDTYTNAGQTIEGITDQWYHITDIDGKEADAWIFGGFTIPNTDAY